MRASDVVTLAESNRWANERRLHRVVHPPPPELHAPCSPSHGTLFRKLLHRAMRIRAGA